MQDSSYTDFLGPKTKTIPSSCVFLPTCHCGLRQEGSSICISWEGGRREEEREIVRRDTSFYEKVEQLFSVSFIISKTLCIGAPQDHSPRPSDVTKGLTKTQHLCVFIAKIYYHEKTQSKIRKGKRCVG